MKGLITLISKVLCSMVLLLLKPIIAASQVTSEIRGLHATLDKLKEDMMPLVDDLQNPAQAVAAFAATFYIGHRVWKHIANSEPIDFYPLLRPFALAFCILNFNSVINIIEGILSPVDVGTLKMYDKTNASVEKLLADREKELKESKAYRMYGVNNGSGDRDEWMKYTHKDEVGREGPLGYITNSMQFAMKKAYYHMANWVKDILSLLLQILFEAAALCINTLRTFNLIIMALLGPLVFGLAVFDGFHHTLTVWLARYVNYYMWLPVARIVGSLLAKIQEEMIKLDMEQLAKFGETFFSTADIGYIIFLIIGIVCYFTVPSIASMIVNAGGGTPHSHRVSSMATRSMTSGTALIAGGTGLVAGAVLGGASRAAGMAADAMGDAHLMNTRGYGGHGSASGYFKDKLSE